MMLIPTDKLTMFERIFGCKRIPITIDDAYVIDKYDSMIRYNRYESMYTGDFFDTTQRPKAVRRNNRLRKLIRKNKFTLYPDHYILVTEYKLQ